MARSCVKDDRTWSRERVKEWNKSRRGFNGLMQPGESLSSAVITPFYYDERSSLGLFIIAARRLDLCWKNFRFSGIS